MLVLGRKNIIASVGRKTIHRKQTENRKQSANSSNRYSGQQQQQQQRQQPQQQQQFDLTFDYITNSNINPRPKCLGFFKNND